MKARLLLERAQFTLDVDLTLPESGITVLAGPSGSGKTTVLRCVAGLERPREARIEAGGEVWQDDVQGTFLPAHQRSIGYVFQEASLFPHLDVRGNIEYGRKRCANPPDDAALAKLVALLGIEHLMARRPQSLSGGERQRVAIARALATGPRMLLLDEPLASLDLARRQEVLPFLERLRDGLAVPMLYVSHTADEIARLADTLVVLQAGRVAASGTAQEVMARADVPLVLGEDAGALLDGVVAQRDEPWQLVRVDFAGGSLWTADRGLPIGHRTRVRVLARDVSVATEEPRATSIQNVLPCTVAEIANDVQPSQAIVRLACGESVLLARLTRRAVDGLRLERTQHVWAQVKSVALVD